MKQPILTYTGHQDGATCVAWSPDGQWIASGGFQFESTAQIWHAKTGLLHTCFNAHGSLSVKAIAWSPDGNLVASYVWDNDEIFVWDPWGGQVLSRTSKPDCHADAGLSWSPDGRYIASFGYKSGLIFRVSDGQC